MKMLVALLPFAVLPLRRVVPAVFGRPSVVCAAVVSWTGVLLVAVASAPAFVHSRSHLTSADAGWPAHVPGVTLSHGGAPVGRERTASKVGGHGGRAGTAKPAGQLVPSLTTATSRTYALPNGEGLIARLFSEPVNFRGADGRWHAIDNRLVPAPGGFRNVANAYGLFVPSDLARPTVVQRGSAWVSSRLVGGQGAAAVSGASARFDAALPGVQVAYQANSAALKETLTLVDASAPQQVTFALRASRGLRARSTRNGGVEVLRGRRVLFSFEAPSAYVAGNADRVHALRATLSRSGGGWRLGVSTGAEWARRALKHGKEVVVDPTVHVTTGIQDCYLNQAAATTSACSQQELDEGSSGAGAERRSLVKFDLSSVPQDSIVADAKLGLYLFGESNTSAKSVGAYEVTSGWTNGATWNTKDGTNNWGSAGGDLSPNPAYTNTATGGSTGWYYWYPTELVQKWVGGALDANKVWHNGAFWNNGVAIKDGAGQPNNLLQFRSSKYTDPTYRPYLDVTYSPRSGELGSYTIDRQSLTDKLSVGVNVANGNLIMHSDELSAPGTGLDLLVDRTYNSNLWNQVWAEFGAAGTAGTLLSMWERNYTDDSVGITFGDGKLLAFYPKPGGGYTSPPGVDGVLTKSATDFTYTLTMRRDGTKLHFGLPGELDKVTDRYGNSVTLSNFDANYHAGTITDTQGRTTSVTYDANTEITDITDWTGRNWHYTYGGAGGRQIATSRDPNGKTTSYDYDSNHLLSKITDPLGNVTLINYDTSNRVSSIVRTTDAGHTTGPTTQYFYDAPGDTTHSSDTCDSSLSKTVVVDPDGGNHKTTYCTNVQGQALDVYDGNHHHQARTYTPSAKPASYTAPSNGGNQVQTSFAYNNDDSITEAKQGTDTGASFHRTWAYTPGTGCSASQFQPCSTTSPSNHNTTYTYDGAGGLATVKDDSQIPNQITLARDGKGNVTSATNANGKTTTYGTDSSHFHITSVNPPAVGSGYGTQIGSTSIGYDSLGRVQTVTDPLAVVTTYGYDGDNRTTSVGFSGGVSSTSYVFDGAGNQTSRTDQLGTESFTYDALNRMTDQTLNGRSSDYSYDNASNLKTLADAGGTVAYGYDDANLLTSVTEPSASAISLTYNNDDQRNHVGFPNGTKLDSTYDHAGRLTSIIGTTATNAVLSSFTYDYLNPDTTLCPGAQANSDLRQSVTDKDGNKTTYCYDGQDRLTRAQTKNSGGAVTQDIRYGYDGTGNITSRTDNSGTTTYAYNADNLLCWSLNGASSNGCNSAPTGATTYSHDVDGQLTGNSAGLALGWHLRGQLQSVKPAGSSTTTALAYQGPDQNQLSGIDSTILQNNVLGIGRKRLSDGTSTYYTRDNTGGLLGERLPNGDRDYYLADGLGSVVGITSPSGAVARSYSYDPYGRQTGGSGTVDNQFTYTGAYEAPGGLLHNGARWYNPSTGRWTQQDPLDQPSDLQQGNRYAYVGGNPINRVDATGTCWAYGRGSGLKLVAESDPRCGNTLGRRIVGGAYRTVQACVSGAKYGIPMSIATGGDSIVAGCVGGIAFRRATRSNVP